MKIQHLVILLVLLVACDNVKNNHRLPYFGQHQYLLNDTIFYTVGGFNLVNQDSMEVTRVSYQNKITIADFFFTSCPTICPVMKTQMLRIYETIEDDDDVLLLSHTIDPAHDTVALLHQYAKNLGVNSSHWQFLTGNKDSIYALAETYMVIADEEPDAPGGFVHSGAFLLIDKEQRIRGVYDGTEPDQVDILINDIDLLRKEYLPDQL